MKCLIAVLAVTLYFNSPAFASWSTQDLVLEGVYLGLLYIDCGQTIYRKQSFPRYREANPLIRYASTDDFRRVCTSLLIFHPIIASHLTEYTRSTFQILSIAFELAAVRKNASIRPSVAFRLSY